MSIRSANSEMVMDYATRKIEADKTLVLIAYGDGEDIIATPLDSDSPGGDFKLVGTFYWNAHEQVVEFRGISTLN